MTQRDREERLLEKIRAGAAQSGEGDPSSCARPEDGITHEKIRAVLTGEATATERLKVEQHLGQCPCCGKWAGDLIESADKKR